MRAVDLCLFTTNATTIMMIVNIMVEMNTNDTATPMTKEVLLEVLLSSLRTLGVGIATGELEVPMSSELTITISSYVIIISLLVSV